MAPSLVSRVGFLFASGVALAGAPAGQTVEKVVALGDSVQGSFIGTFADIAIGDDGEWFAVSVLGTNELDPAAVLHGTVGVQGLFQPDTVANLPGVTATLFNRRVFADYTRTATTVHVAAFQHGLLPGGLVRLDFTSGAATDGLYTIAGVPDVDTFTVIDSASGDTSGRVQLLRIIGPPDLHYSPSCSSAFQGLMQMHDDLDPSTPPVVTPSTDETGLFWNNVLLLRAGSLSNAPEVGPGTTYRRFFRSLVDARQDVLLQARMEDPAVPGLEDALLRIDLAPGCAPGAPSLVSESVIVRTGTPILPTTRTFSTFASTDKGSFAWNDRGEVIYLGWLSGADIDRRVIFNRRAILAEFGPLPGGRVGTENVIAITAASVDLNNFGDYVIQVKTTTGDPRRTGTAIVKGRSNHFENQTAYRQSGNTTPDPSLGGATLIAIGENPSFSDTPETFPVHITNSGDVIWYGEWRGGAGDGGGIFVNDMVVVRRGQAIPGTSLVLDEIGTTGDYRNELEVSPNGRYLFFAGLFSGPGLFQNVGLFRVDLGESMPYGTVEQADGGSGCRSPYPALTFQSQPGAPFPGTTALGDFPLLGHQIQAFATFAPPATNQVAFVFTDAAPRGYPCGLPLPPFGGEVLIGPGRIFFAFLRPYLSPRTGHSAPIPFDPALIGSIWYGQAFFFTGATMIGASNGLRFVIGAN